MIFKLFKINAKLKHQLLIMSISTAQNQQENNETQNFVTPQTFKLKNFGLSPVIEKYCSKAQYNSFPKYKYSKDAKDGETLIVATDKIKLTKGGIPKIDGEYRKSDKDRGFFWLGCDNEQPELVALFDMLRSIDEEYAESLKNNKDTSTLYILKDKQKEPIDKLEYVPIVRESAQPEDKKGDKEYEPYDRIKVKFNTKYDKDLPEGQVADITTSLFVGDREEPENLATVTDFEKFLRWNCEAIFVLEVNKFWAMKAVKNKKRECGLSIKCLQVYITKEAPATGASTGERFKKRLFGSSGKPTVPASVVVAKQTDNDEEPEEETPAPVVKEDSKTKSSKPVTNQESSEEEDSEESEEEDNDAPAQEQEDDSEESEESEVEDSPPPPPRKKSTKTTTPAKKKQSTDESEESEEKPKPKGKGGKK